MSLNVKGSLGRAKTEKWDGRTEAEVMCMKIKERAMSQGMQGVSKNLKREVNTFSPEASKRNTALPTYTLISAP